MIERLLSKLSAEAYRQGSSDASGPQLDLAALQHSAALDISSWTDLRTLPDAFGDACPQLTSLKLSGEKDRHSANSCLFRN